MRTKTSLLSAAVIAAGLVSASAQVYSVNVVGYVNSALQGTNRYTLIANPLDNKVSNAYSNLLNSLPNGSQVLRWTGAGYSTATRSPLFAGWLPNGSETNVLTPGNGVFVRSPLASGPITNTFVGEVLQGALVNPLPTGYALKGTMAPIAGTATELGLTAAIPPTGGSQLLKWNPNTQSYQTFNRSPVGAGWLPSVPSLAVGEGYFVRNLSGVATNWTMNFTVN